MLAFNVRNAHSELKKLNELTFKQLFDSHGSSLLNQFDDKCREQVQVLIGQDSSKQKMEIFEVQQTKNYQAEEGKDE